MSPSCPTPEAASHEGAQFVEIAAGNKVLIEQSTAPPESAATCTSTPQYLLDFLAPKEFCHGKRANMSVQLWSAVTT